MLAVLFEAKLM